MNSTGSKTPNDRLRSERELRGWSQVDLAERIGTTQKIVSRWERGESVPLPYYQQKLIKLFGKDAAALGFRNPEKRDFSSLDKGSYYQDGYSTESTPLSSVTEREENLTVQGVPVALHHAHQAIDTLMGTPDITPEKRLGVLLALEANQLATFFDEGWSIDELLKTLGAVLPGIEAMSKITRRAFGRKLLQFGVLATVSGIPDPSKRHISAEERAELHAALGESIASGWKLVQTSKPDQILALGHAQLSLVQESSSLLYPNVRPLLYSGVFRLIGAALHFQSRYVEAFQAHEQAYLTALEGMDIWNMVQSRQWQADALKAQGRYDESLQTTDAALRLISTQSDLESIRTKAHLLASSAEVAALMGDKEGAQFRLRASEEIAGQLSRPHEEFDQISWHQLAGTCALILRQYDAAIGELEQAINKLPPQWTLRYATVLTPLAIAYARIQEKAKCLDVAEKATQVMEMLSSSALNQQFAGYMQQELPASFQNDGMVRDFLKDIERRLIPGETSLPTLN